MELKVCHENGYVLAATSGPIDESAEEAFREWIHPLIGRGGTRVVLDLADSRLINSKGIGQLVLLAANANSNGSRVVLAAPTPFVSIVFSRCKLDKFFEITPTVADAILLVEASAC
jgi:anti-anti-sigma factor